jgi:hypothetical protein
MHAEAVRVLLEYKTALNPFEGSRAVGESSGTS